MNESVSGENFPTASDGQVSDPPDHPDYHVAIANEQQLLAIDEALLVQAVQRVLGDTNLQSAEISIAVVDDPTIHQLNVQFLQHDYPTDVLSFALEESDVHLEGELIVSADTASREAVEAGWRAHDELLLYVLHGTLHLVGYLDEQPENRQQMLAAEKKYLLELGIALPTDVSRWSDAKTEEPATPDRSEESQL